LNESLYSKFGPTFARLREQTALAFRRGAGWTFAELDAQAGRFAALLEREGVARGERVVVQVDKSPAAVALYLGALRAGAVFVPLNPAYTPREVEGFLADADPKLFIARPEAPAPAGVRTLRLGAAPDDPLMRTLHRLAPAPAADLGADDLAAILYTSGTTGRSKGAMLSHGNLASNADALVSAWGMSEKDVLIHALPIFHVHGLFVALNTAFLAGATTIFLPAFDAAEVRARLRDATLMMGVPTFYTRLLDDEGFGEADCARMRLFISGSAPLAARDWTRFRARTGHEILERYGMTEAGMIASNPLAGERVAGSVGFALPGVDVRVADAAGAEPPRGAAGVIEVKGPNVFKGYWRMPEKSAEDFRADGWFITGDVGEMDHDGRLRIVGRAKDLIISGGYNIYPSEIEAVLDAVPGVRESAVVGAPHPDLGEGVVAVLVAETAPVDAAAIAAALAENLARFKHPRRVFWVEALPRNAMGKIEKAALRKSYARAYQQ
jgi:malonyl-CoA/methylmalonyl-CoA synthetase